MVQGPNRNVQIFDPLDFLAAVTCHMPNRGDHLVRYYAWYSSVQRGWRPRPPPVAAVVPADFEYLPCED